MGVSMSEIQRFDIRGESWGIVERTDGLGAFCWYDEAAWYKRQYWMALLINVVVILVCAVLAALLVHEKASRGPVVVPMGAGEKASILRDVQAMQKSRDDYKVLALNYKAQIKMLNTKVDGHVSQLEALQARGQELSQLNKEQAQRMSTHQGVRLEAKRVLGVKHVQVVE